jgi:hypothetical protein
VATLKRRLRRRGEGVPDGTAGEAASVDLSHQTLAIARNPKGFGGDWLVRSSCLAEWGSTTGRRSWPGAEGAIALPLLVMAILVTLADIAVIWPEI